MTNLKKNEVVRTVNQNDLPVKVLTLIDEFWPNLKTV
jgi:hypothetical protein